MQVRRAVAGPLLGVVLVLTTIACARGATANRAPFDQQFIDMMVPHHQGAVEMAKIAQQRAEHTEVRQLSDAIVRTQNDEIGKMRAWRKTWYGSEETPPLTKMPMVPGMATGPSHGGGHGESGGTMDMAADVEALRKSGTPFDRAFIDAMIPHHESAIEAATAAATRAQKQEIKDLALAIVADQQREIDQMKRWRQAWYG